MLRDQRTIHGGLTLIETLVSIAIVGILVCFFFLRFKQPGSLRKTQCQNNLKQTALALQAFHDANNNLPSHYNGTSLSYPLNGWNQYHLHSWRAALLPYLEQFALHGSIDWHALATDRVNEPAATTVVPPYICPSGASPTASMTWAPREVVGSRLQGDEYRVIRSDYDGLLGIYTPFVVPPPGTWGADANYIDWGVWSARFLITD